MTCTVCSTDLEPAMFSPGKVSCKPCRAAKARQWRLDNPEKYAAQQARKRSAEGRAKQREYEAKRDPEAKRVKDRRYWARHARDLNRRQAAAYKANPEPAKARAKAWRAANRERHRELGRLDRRKRYLARDTEAFEFGEVLRHDPCSYCGGPAGTVDHIVPLAIDGTNEWANLTASCLSCNSRKRTRSLLTFLPEVAA